MQLLVEYFLNLGQDNSSKTCTVASLFFQIGLACISIPVDRSTIFVAYCVFCAAPMLAEHTMSFTQAHFLGFLEIWESIDSILCSSSVTFDLIALGGVCVEFCIVLETSSSQSCILACTPFCNLYIKNCGCNTLFGVRKTPLDPYLPACMN